MNRKIEDIREFYDNEYHFSEDILAFDMKRIQRYLRGFVFEDGQDLIDIGCGAGLNLMYFREHNLTLYGLDLSVNALFLAREMVPGARLMVGDGQGLPFEENTFDLATSIGVIEHFPAPLKGLQEMYRILKPGGRVCIVVPNSFGRLGKMMGYTGTEQEQELLQSLDQWKAMIHSAGFAIDRVKRDRGPRIFKNWKPAKIFARLVLRLTLIMPKKLAYQFVFHLSKPPEGDDS